jgi:hypothetical protein
MTEAELRLALADMRAIAQAEKDFTQTNVRQVDVSAEDVEAIRIAYLWLARLYKPLRDHSEDPDAFGEFGSPEMRRKMPLHRLYAIGERWQAGGQAERPLREPLMPSRGFRAVVTRSRAIATGSRERLRVRHRQASAERLVRRALGRPAALERGLVLTAPSFDVLAAPYGAGGEAVDGRGEVGPFRVARRCAPSDAEQRRKLLKADEPVGGHVLRVQRWSDYRSHLPVNVVSSVPCYHLSKGGSMSTTTEERDRAAQAVPSIMRGEA